MRGTSIGEGAAKTLLARALYDNHPDCPEELAFSRGDLLTILEQNVPESEGWWKCRLHGRQGLAPANRLQILTEVPPERSCAPFPEGLGESITSSEGTYQVPMLLHPPPPGPVYEPMKSWVEGPLPLAAQVYEFPDPPPSARIVCEKTCFPKQALFVLPRPSRASLPTLPSQVYDVPVQRRIPSALKEPEKQQLYDILPSPQKAALCLPDSQAGDVPLTPMIAFRREGCNTLPSLQKSEWIYDTPVSLGKASVRNTALTSFVEEAGPDAAPPAGSSSPSPPDGRARTPLSQPCSKVPMKKNFGRSEVPSHTFPGSRDTLSSEAIGSYKVPSSFLISRGVEQQNTKPNIYDIPKAMPSGSQAGKELGKAKEAPENPRGLNASWSSRRTTSLSPEPDRSSISSSDSRASVVSSCSSMSTDSCSTSSSEESAKEFSLDLNLAKETAMALQHKVVSSAAGLLLFVSRKWRFRDSLEANIDAIHRAADDTEAALREFLDFALGVCGSTCNLANSYLRTRIQHQLQTISNSYQILVEAKGNLDSHNWSLEALVTDKAQNSPDDLERFVMVARVVPEDVKRFTSIVIANGRLLFKQNCEKEETTQWTPDVEFTCKRCIQLPQREAESCQRNIPFNKPREGDQSPELFKKNGTSACEQMLHNLEEKETSLLEQKLDENKELSTTSPSSLTHQPLSPQNPGRKVHLSEHCRLYFGALFKAISVFHSSLSNSQPPEVFVTQSKLVIMVGQKLVDTLCKETQEKDMRNEILCSSSHLCGLLKDLALATKNAVLQYPSPAALGHLQAEAKKLEHHTRQFRGTLD